MNSKGKIPCHSLAVRVRQRGFATVIRQSFLFIATVGLGCTIATAQFASDRNVPFGSPVGGQTQSAQQDRSNQADASAGTQSSPLYELQPVSPVYLNNANERPTSDDRREAARELAETTIKVPPPPSEFETYVERSLGRRLKRFGSDLIIPSTRDFAVPATSVIPPDYKLGVGDSVAIAMTGSVEGSVTVTIDQTGRIFLPKIGSLMLAGVANRDLQETISKAIGRQYRGYTVTARVDALRGVRVYVTGFANNPGAFTVNSLSTMVNAVLAAGGPSSGGSFRSVRLYRNGALVRDFDLYELLRQGNRSNDATLENEDVLYIPPVGDQVAVVGSVNEEAIYEAKPGETVEKLVQFAGGPNVLADDSRVILYRLSNLDVVGAVELTRPEAIVKPIAAGDILAVLSNGSLLRPRERQSIIVRLEGEVAHPGNYYVPPGSTLQQVLDKAGGLTSQAFPYGTRLERISVQQQQREGYGEAIEQLELALASTPTSADGTLTSAENNAQLSAARAVLDRIRNTTPDGRVVISIAPDATTLPGAILLENNDRIVVPPRPTTLGVFGAVYRPASFLIDTSSPTTRVRDYIEEAGGLQRSADRKGIFVVRANGAVISSKRGALAMRTLPGDVVFVPVKTRSSSLWAKIRDLSTIIAQVGLSTAAFVAVAK